MDVRLFIDSSNVEEVREAVESGIVGGVATNPNKCRLSGKSVEKVVEEIRKFFDGPISVQALGKTAGELIERAKELNKLSKNLAIKIPTNQEGIKAVKELVAQGIATNATLIFNPAQGLAAGLAGSPLISPFVGRARAVGGDGIETIAQIRKMYDRYQISTKIIAASIKDVGQVIDSIIAGADMVAVPYGVFKDVFRHPLTEEGIKNFIADENRD